jgi:hypothetical protein
MQSLILYYPNYDFLRVRSHILVHSYKYSAETCCFKLPILKTEGSYTALVLPTKI